MQLRVQGTSPLRWLVLEPTKRLELALGIDHGLNVGRAKCSNQFIFEIGFANEEADSFHLGAGEAYSHSHPFKTPADITLFGGIVETREPEPQPHCAEHLDVRTELGHASDGEREDPLGSKIPTASLCKRIDRCLVAPSFYEDRRPRGYL
jgi:hypothetical protein